MAALFTRISSRPKRSTAWRKPAFTCSRVGDVHLHGQRLAACRGDLLRQLCKFFAIARRHDDARSGARERQRGGAADPLRRAGHQRDAIF